MEEGRSEFVESPPPSSAFFALRCRSVSQAAAASVVQPVVLRLDRFALKLMGDRHDTGLISQERKKEGRQLILFN